MKNTTTVEKKHEGLALDRFEKNLAEIAGKYEEPEEGK